MEGMVDEKGMAWHVGVYGGIYMALEWHICYDYNAEF